MSSEVTARTRGNVRSRLGAVVTGWARGLGLWAISLVSLGLLAALPLATAQLVDAYFTNRRGYICGLGLGLLFLPGVIVVLRPLANLTRALADWWCGVPMAVPYLQPPGAGKKKKTKTTTRVQATLWWVLRDPASWRDMAWMFISPCVSWVLPLAAWASPRVLHRYGLLARSMLAPAGQGELALRVRHLARTRAETIDTGAAELRRIERDLHDGAQARLVAMGMTLDAADQLVIDNPAAARALLAEARQSSVKALNELRGLVRGIHPPVLADRGLSEAVRGLILDTPMRVQLSGELDGRPPAPVESAAYFAVSELLANVSKHAQPGQAWVDLRYEYGMLHIAVGDDGAGGADPAKGTGLAGIERRLAAFDGVLAVSSPPGGPTIVTMEIPCALSSPKTSSC